MALSKRIIALAAGAVLALAGTYVPGPTAELIVTTHEGKENTAYLDPVRIPTICYGNTKNVRLGQTATDAECKALLKRDLTYAAVGIAKGVKVPITQGQYDALVSFVYNVGETQFYKSTLLKQINAGNCMQAGAEFRRWVYAGGKVLPGLIKRRADERLAFEEGCKVWPSYQQY